MFSLPAEWEKQSGVLITWPHNHSDWADNLSEIEATYIQLSAAISKFQKLLVIVYDLTLQTHIKSILSNHPINMGNIVFHIFKTDDTWTRDYGPIYLTDNQQGKTITRLLDFTFNGWGNKFSAILDNQLNVNLLDNKVINADESATFDFILEGGSIESDGNETVLTTSSCLLSNERNISYNQDYITLFLQRTLSVKQVLWLDEGYLAGDDTDSHIDVLARFIDSNTIVYVKCEDEADEHYASSLAMEAQLKTFKNISGQPYNLVSLPFPNPKYNANKRRLPASYTNFLMINGAVLVPTYDDPNDELALKILKNCIKDREIIGIPFSSAIQENGSLHCLTMQLPFGVLADSKFPCTDSNQNKPRLT